MGLIIPSRDNLLRRPIPKRTNKKGEKRKCKTWEAFIPTDAQIVHDTDTNTVRAS